MNKRTCIAIGLAALLGLVSSISNAAPLVSAHNYVSGEVLVKFKPSVGSQQRTTTISAMGNRLVANLRHDWVRVSVGAGKTVAQTLSAYANDPNVEYAQPNYIYHTTAVPNDPQYGSLWGFSNTGQTVSSVTQGEGWIYSTDNPGATGDDMDIEPAWSHITDCSNAIIAVVDTGVNYNQEDLAGNMWDGSGATYNGTALTNHGYDFVDSDNDPMDLNGHGTHVAGIIGAVGNNGTGTTGVCWTAKIMAVRVLDAAGSGTTSNIVQGIDFAVANGAKVINMSLGGGGAFDQFFSDAITNAENNDVVVVVAAGNDGVNNDTSGNAHWPCDFTQPNLICVAALDQRFALASFSDWGATSVDVGAPGTNILSTFAGSNSTISDTFSSGWTTSTTTSGGWTAGAVSFSAGSSTPVLADPSSWPSGLYTANTDDRAYKSFNLSGVDAATISAALSANVTSDASIGIADNAAGGDPFAPATPTYLLGPGPTETTPTAPSGYYAVSANLSNCISTTCSIGLRLVTGNTQDYGAALYDFTIQTLTLNTNSYNTLNGTSMATPEVAGLAAMLRAYNPQDTYLDVVNSIKYGGRFLSTLNGKTTSSRAIDVMKSLAYINAPTGLTATVH